MHNVDIPNFDLWIIFTSLFHHFNLCISGFRMSIGGSCIMLYLSLSLCPSLCPSLWLYVLFYLHLHVYLSPCLSLCLSLWSICLYLSISVIICLYPSISVYICLHLSISVYIRLYLSLSVYICLYLSISVYICLYLSLFLSLFLPIYQSINQSVYLWYKYYPAIIYRISKIFGKRHPIHPPGHHQHRFGARFCGPGSLASGHWDEQPDLVLLLRRPGLGPVRQRTEVHWERGKRELERHTRLRAGDFWDMMRWGI